MDNKVYRMQFFERAVFELHPENAAPYNVLLSLLGVEAYAQKNGSAGAPDQYPSTDNPRYFPETGHTMEESSANIGKGTVVWHSKASRFRTSSQK